MPPDEPKAPDWLLITLAGWNGQIRLMSWNLDTLRCEILSHAAGHSFEIDLKIYQAGAVLRIEPFRIPLEPREVFLALERIFPKASPIPLFPELRK